MIAREVFLSLEARSHLLALCDWIADQTSPDIALAYVERLEKDMRSFDLASERGARQADIRRDPVVEQVATLLLLSQQPSLV